MAISKGGVLGSVLGRVGSVSGYVRYGSNVIQSNVIDTKLIKAPDSSLVKFDYNFFVNNYKAAHNIFFKFFNFPELLVVDTKLLPLTNYVKKGLGLKVQIVEVPTISGFIGNVKANVVVNQASLPEEIRFNIYCDRSQFLTDEVVIVAQAVVSLKGLSVYNDFRRYEANSVRFFNVYNNEDPSDVFYCDVFVYGRTSGRVSNITSFLTKLNP